MVELYPNKSMSREKVTPKTLYGILAEAIYGEPYNYLTTGAKKDVIQANAKIIKLLPSEDISVDAIKLPDGVSAIEQGGYKDPYVRGLERGIRAGIKEYRKQTLINFGVKGEG